MILWVTPPIRIKTPANIKKGMAVNRKESAPATIFRAAIEKGRPCRSRATQELKSMAKPIGKPKMRKRPSKASKITIMVPASTESLDICPRS
jgi:hypothetical protein